MKPERRLAERGSRSVRFSHGKLDLTQGRSRDGLITCAGNDLALRAAHEQSPARGAGASRPRRSESSSSCAIEEYIDFPDEDIAPETGDALHARLTELPRNSTHCSPPTPAARLTGALHG